MVHDSLENEGIVRARIHKTSDSCSYDWVCLKEFSAVLSRRYQQRRGRRNVFCKPLRLSALTQMPAFLAEAAEKAT